MSQFLVSWGDLGDILAVGPQTVEDLVANMGVDVTIFIDLVEDLGVILMDFGAILGSP